MHRKSPITHPVVLEKSIETRNWKLNSELLFNFSTFAFFIYWLKKAAEPVWSFLGLRFFFAPVGALGSLLAAVFSIRQAVLKQDSHSISGAVIDVLAAGATIVGAIAIIGSIAALAVIGPLLITASIALKTLYSLGSAIGFAIHSLIEKNQDLKTVYRTKATEALVDGVIGSIITAAAITLMFVAAPVVQTVMASIAVAASAFTIVHFVVKAAKNTERLRAEAEAIQMKEFQANSDNTINNKLGASAENRLLHAQQKTSAFTLPANETNASTAILDADINKQPPISDIAAEETNSYRP